jgi:hypothetical protein
MHLICFQKQHMRYLLFIAVILFSSTQTFAQKDTSLVEQYCEVVSTPRLLSSKVTIDIDYGEVRSIWRDNRVKSDDGKLKKFNTVIDALNYMGIDGWTLVNAFPTVVGNSQTYHYVFKKSFKKSEVAE